MFIAIDRVSGEVAGRARSVAELERMMYAYPGRVYDVAEFRPSLSFRVEQAVSTVSVPFTVAD